jgi:hypothetical protein
MKSLYRNVLATNVALALALTPAVSIVPEKPPGNGNMLDDTKNGGGENEGPGFVITDEMRQEAAGIVAEWADSELETGEGYADRLYALIVGAAGGGDDDEDLTDDQAQYAAILAELVGDYLEGKKIPEDDVDTLLGGDLEDNDLAARIHDVLLDSMPQGDDAMMDDTEKFVLGESDDAMLDATYKKVMAIRAGKKVRIKKRIAGRVRLTAAQKGAVRKMQRKAFSGAAKMKRARSMRMHRKMIGA